MTQHLKKHIKAIILAVALLLAMLFQYVRISNLDIAFLLEISSKSYIVYAFVLLLVPVLVLFFVFIPILFVFELSYNIQLPKSYGIIIKKITYSIKPISDTTIMKPRVYTVLRC